MLEAFFLAAEPGERFCIYYPSAGPTAGGIVYVHPFGEEMNKARRMAALQARRLAARGYAVMQIDLFGCGDSSGEFGEARWDVWKNDVRSALAWLGRRVPGRLGLWGLRLGAVLAAELSADASLAIDRLLLWQPVSNGEQFLTQFLRLRLASEMLTAGTAQSEIRGLREALQRGETLEIAGYELHPALAAAIEQLKLAQIIPMARAVRWLEVSAAPGAEVSPASKRTVKAWLDRSVPVQATSVQGDPFWATTEITECAPLLAASTLAMEIAP